MAEPLDVTNADDVTITVLGDNTNKAGAEGKLVVDSFEWAESTEGETKSGVGNRDPIGATFGNNTYEFSLTLEGDDAELMNDLAPADDDGKPPAVQITIKSPKYKHVVPTAWALDRTYSGSDGDAVQYEVSGIAMAPEREAL